MRWKLVVFDFDGTLADTFDWFNATLGEMAAKYRFRTPDPLDTETLRHMHAGQILSHLGVRWWKVPFVAEGFRKAMARDIRAIKPFPGTLEAIDKLGEAGIELAIASSNSRGNIESILGERSGRFKYWECGTSLQGKASRLKKILKASGVRPGEAILVGDEIRDAQAAREAGIGFAAVAWGYNREATLRAQAPDSVFRTPSEIVPGLLIES